MRTGDARSRHGTVWPLAHHGYKDLGWALRFRSRLGARLILDQFRGEQELGLGHWLIDPEGEGDVIGGQLLRRSTREISTWRFATPVVVDNGDDPLGGPTSGGTGGGVGPGFPFGIGGQAGGSGVSPGFTFTPQGGGAGGGGAAGGGVMGPASPGTPTPTGAAPVACAILDEFEILPILDKDYGPDTRLQVLKPTRPKRNGIDLWPKFPRDYFGISLIADEENEQIDLFHPTDPRLIGVHREGDPEMSSLFCDMAPGFRIDPLRMARMSSLLRTIKDPQGLIDWKGENSLSLNITDSGCEDVRGGLFTDKPRSGLGASSLRVHGLFSANDTGPLTAGDNADKHAVGDDADGDPIHSGHIQTGAYFHRTVDEDAPLFFETRFIHIEHGYPPVMVNAPFSTPVLLEYDPAETHDFFGSNRDGMWKWRAESFIYTPTKNGRVPDPNGPGPGPPTPTEGGNTSDPGAVPVSDEFGEPTIIPRLPDITPLPVPLELIGPATETGILPRNFSAMTMELAGPAFLARPQLIGNESIPDLRQVSTGISEEVLHEFDSRTPIAARLEAWGRQPNNDWEYAVNPCTERFLGGTVDGGWTLMPSEVDITDFRDVTIESIRGVEPPFDFVDTITNYPPDDRALSVAYLNIAPLSFSSWGLPDLDTGAIKLGYRAGTDLEGNLGFDCVDKDGVATRVLTLTRECKVEIPIPGLVRGASVTFVSVSIVDVGTAGESSQVTDSTDTTTMIFTGTLRADITASGAGGLDTGAEAADTWYAIHVIGDSTGVNAPDVILSVSATAPTLPGTHNVFRRVGWVRNNGSSNFLKFNQEDSGLDRLYIFDEDRGNLQPLSAGTATVFMAVAAIANFMPPTATHVLVNVGFDTVNAGDLVDFRPTGSAVTSAVSHVQLGTSTGGANHMTNHIEMLLPTQSFDYRITLGAGPGADVDVFVQGFVDNL